MVTGTSYAEARLQFVRLGLGVRRMGRAPFSTSSGEMKMALGAAGLLVQPKRWKGWSSFKGLGIIKAKDDWKGFKGKFHWVVAFEHPDFGITVFDPHETIPSFQRMPNEVECYGLGFFEGKGEMLQVEQRLQLVIPT